jgi:tetrahydromethanopterin S-methyltransferase subunit E
LTGLFYTILYRGLLACSAIIGLIVSLVVYRKMWRGGKSIAEMGNEGNVLIFMIALIALSLLIAWRIKLAMKKLDQDWQNI